MLMSRTCLKLVHHASNNKGNLFKTAAQQPSCVFNKDVNAVASFDSLFMQFLTVLSLQTMQGPRQTLSYSAACAMLGFRRTLSYSGACLMLGFRRTLSYSGTCVMLGGLCHTVVLV